MPLPRYPNDEKIPPRKPHCKNYDECLDEAARKNKCFCCTGCRNFRKRTEKTLLCSDELLNIYALWREVFQSDYEWFLCFPRFLFRTEADKSGKTFSGERKSVNFIFGFSPCMAQNIRKKYGSLGCVFPVSYRSMLAISQPQSFAKSSRLSPSECRIAVNLFGSK